MAKHLKLGDQKTAVGYLRVSTTEQHLGPLAQAHALEVWAAAHGVHLVAVFFDNGISGAAPIERRPGLCAALAALRTHNAGFFIAQKRDRWARDVLVSATIEQQATKAGARLLSADGAGNGDSDADYFMRDIEAARSAYERRLIGSRTRAALAVKRARGERISRHIPYGLKLAADCVRLVPNPVELAVLARMRELRAAGLSQRAVGQQLAAEGIATRSGRAFTQAQVQKLLADAAPTAKAAA